MGKPECARPLRKQVRGQEPDSLSLAALGLGRTNGQPASSWPYVTLHRHRSQCQQNTAVVSAASENG